MGGDTFEGVQKLTNQEYITYVPQILEILHNHYTRAQAYIPVPEKQVHGDIDFLMILAPNVPQKSVLEALKMEKFIINQNNTINAVYNNKQVDFCFVASENQFQIMRFYKSYSGLGAYLGIFMPSREIKLSDKGLFAMGFHKHIKYEYLITNSVEDILTFYGLSYEHFKNGFQTRIELFKFLSTCKFLDIDKLKQYNTSHSSKITKFFVKYLIEAEIKENKKPEQIVNYAEPQKQTLKYFNKSQQFEKSFEDCLKKIQRVQELKKKFNATHLMEKYDIKAKKVNKWKQQFADLFKDQEDYNKFVQEHSLQEILNEFDQKLGARVRSNQTCQNQKDSLSKSLLNSSGEQKTEEVQAIMKPMNKEEENESISK